MKKKLLPKFIWSMAVLGIILTIAISTFSYQTSKTYLEDMYAHRVISGSKTVAAMLDVEDIEAIIAPGGDESEAYAHVSEILNKVKLDDDVTFLSLVVPDEDSVTFYVDACVEEMGDDPAAQIPYGMDILYTDAAYDEVELAKYLMAWELYSENKGTDEPAVTDNDYGYNYTAVYPILDENGQAIAEIQYILDMNAMRQHLDMFLVNMLGVSLGIICLALFLYVLTVRKLVIKPIDKLTQFTTDITHSGQFEKQRIEIHTGDEIEALGSSFNFMLEELVNYIENLTTVTAEKERIGAELDVAKHIQSSMLPCIFPPFPDRSEFDIYATMTPAKEVGGDFYDFFMVDERHLAIVMADVSGKGIPAALFMVIGKTLIKDHTQPGADLGQVFTQVNNILCDSNSEGMFITAFEGVLDLATGELRFVNAGHEMPFVSRAGAAFEPQKIRAGFVLAGMEDMKYKAGVLQLEPGDKLFQYTDGVTEATNTANELYGMKRLEATLSALSHSDPEEILSGIKRDIDEFVGEAPQFDDITMLCLEYKQKMEVPQED